MIELLVGSGAKGNSYFPDSGPGSKTLIYGDEDFGYFGTLTVDEFMQYTELRRQLSFYEGNSVNLTNNEWVKVIFKKKVLFFPRKYISGSISWNTLYDNGLVHGVNDNGPFQSPNGPTNQQRIVNTKGSNFRVRLFSAHDIDPSTQTGAVSWGNQTTSPASEINKSELGTILNGLIANPNAGYPGHKWGVLTGDSFFNGINGVTQKTIASNNLNCQLAVGNTGVSTTAKTIIGGWLPVLELIPSTEVIIQAASDVEALAVTELTPVTVTDIIQDVGFRAIKDPAILADSIDAVHSVTITYS